MSRAILLLPLVLYLLLGACQKKLEGPPEVASERDSDDSTELVFLLDDQRFDADGSQTFSARGLLDGKAVGFGVHLGSWMENGPGYLNLTTWECAARIVSRGTESDQLLQYIDRLYRAQVPAPYMAKSVDCKVISIWENPGKLQNESVKLLFTFRGSDDEMCDSEVWMEVRPKERRVILREKDPRFRKALIQALVMKFEFGRAKFDFAGR